jgi:hypothetical protein
MDALNRMMIVTVKMRFMIHSIKPSIGKQLKFQKANYVCNGNVRERGPWMKVDDSIDLILKCKFSCLLLARCMNWLKSSGNSLGVVAVTRRIGLYPLSPMVEDMVTVLSAEMLGVDAMRCCGLDFKVHSERRECAREKQLTTTHYKTTTPIRHVATL